MMTGDGAGVYIVIPGCGAVIGTGILTGMGIPGIMTRLVPSTRITGMALTVSVAGLVSASGGGSNGEGSSTNSR